MATFADAPEVLEQIDHLLQFKEFEDLQEATILARFRYADSWTSGGRRILAQAKVLSNFERFEMEAELVVFVDGGVWPQLDERQREALIHHELSHFERQRDTEGMAKTSKDDDRPLFKIKGHDLEDFKGTVERYGFWMPDVKEFVKSAAKGAQLEWTFN